MGEGKKRHVVVVVVVHNGPWNSKFCVLPTNLNTGLGTSKSLKAERAFFHESEKMYRDV